MRKVSKNFLFILLGNFLVFSLSGGVQGKTPDGLPWENLETKYTIIYYQSLEDLKKFNKNIDYPQGGWGLFKALLSRPCSDDLTDKLKKKVDALYGRVQEILDMHKKMKKVKIIIYPNKEQLHTAYSGIYKKSSRSYKTSSLLRAWYIYEYNTIYLNVNDLHEGMLAHEMAHSIIDHYLLVRPPKATAEILARYVDSHLIE